MEGGNVYCSKADKNYEQVLEIIPSTLISLQDCIYIDCIDPFAGAESPYHCSQF